MNLGEFTSKWGKDKKVENLGEAIKEYTGDKKEISIEEVIDAALKGIFQEVHTVMKKEEVDKFIGF